MRALAESVIPQTRVPSRRALPQMLVLIALGATWALMFLGAFTRAELAGSSCPDWPLCHGYVVPPTHDAAYPPSPMYTAHKVYFEFTHRVLALGVALLAVAIGLFAAKAGHRFLAFALWAVLGVQIFLGALTVWLGNAPFTVVLHLAAGLGFLTVLLAIHQRLTKASGKSEGVLILPLLIVAQMLVGAYVSSHYYGLACGSFPLCEGGRWIPASFTEPVLWQLFHRALGVSLLLTAAVLAIRRRSTPQRLVYSLLLAQVLLGALTVWLRIPPLMSALHLGLAVLIYALSVRPLLARE